MRNAAQPVYLAVIFLIFISCGGGGKGSSPGEPAPEEEPEPFTLKTTVGFETLEYSLAQTISCLEPADKIIVPAVSETYTLDGKLHDWSESHGVISDPKGDTSLANDIGNVFLGTRGSDIVIGVEARQGSDITTYFEFGGAVLRAGSHEREVLRLVRFNEEGLKEYRNGEWTELTDEYASFASEEYGFEAEFTRRLLGEVTTWPAWWVRVYNQPDTNPSLGDTTHAAFFPSLLGGDNSSLVFSGCNNWSTRKIPFKFKFIRDASTDLEEEFPMEEATKTAFQTARLSFDAVTAMTGYDGFSALELAVFATTKNIETRVKALEPLSPKSEIYQGVAVDLGQLGNESTDPFPRGEIFKTLSDHLLDQYLEANFPLAPKYLRKVVRTALLDHLIMVHIGPSYWLDMYMPSVQAFVDQPDTSSPLPLFEMWSDNERLGNVKATALGHMISRMWLPDLIIAAWKSAGSRADERGGHPDSLLKEAFVSQLTASQRPTVQKLWSGWLEHSAYVAGFQPLDVSDRDADGLPDYWEHYYGTDSQEVDTDKDGWSDFAELFNENDPLSISTRPNVIMPDGIFNDWLELMPKRITIDLGVTGSCPKAADISYFSALATEDKMIIGALATDFWPSEPKAKWEALLDFPLEDRQVLITSQAGSNEIFFKDPETFEVLKSYRRAMPQGLGSIEWVIDRAAIGMETPFIAPDGLKIRLRTVYTEGEDDLFCDETDWFSPNISETDVN